MRFCGTDPSSQTAKLWRLSDNSLLRTLTDHSNTVYSVEFSPDGTLLATTSSDGTARLWRVPDGSVVRVFQGGGGSAVKFSSDGRLLLTLNGGPISLWRASNGQWLHTYTNANASALDVASDGKHFVYGRNDGAVVLARLPLWIIEATYQDYAVTLRWQGGSGRYQVQARMSFATGAWQNLGGPTTNTESTYACLSPMFYRVQSLLNE